jgi:hypothetical protein
LRNAFLGQAVIAGKHQQHALVRSRLGWMPDQAELHGKILDPPERARRLGFAVDAPAQCGFKGTIERRHHGHWPGSVRFRQGRHLAPVALLRAKRFA